MKFQLVTPEKIAFEAEVKQLTLPTTSGELTILPGHVPLVSQLAHGALAVQDERGAVHYFAVAGGFLSVTSSGIRILAESADHEDDVDLAAAETAKRRALKLRDEAADHEEIATAVAALERSLAAIRVAQRKHRHRAKTL